MKSQIPWHLLKTLQSERNLACGSKIEMEVEEIE
jgi:hypothetical protein